MTDSVIVVIGDIVSSRKIMDRVAFDNGLLRTLEELNARNADILSPYTLTIGDEIQAVFGRADSLFHDAVSILAAIHPEKMRFSWGLGRLTKPITPNGPLGWMARPFTLPATGWSNSRRAATCSTSQVRVFPISACCGRLCP